MTNNKQQTAVDFVPYELALELKQLQFNEPCIAHYTVVPEDNINWFTISEQSVTGNSSIFGSSKNYNTEWFETEGTISAPTYAQAFRWFREKHNLRCQINYIGGLINKTTWWDISVIGHYNTDPKEWEMKYQPYEEAELACLEKLIEIAKTHEGGNND